MILNVFSIMVIFWGLISLVLMVWIGVLSLILWLRFRAAATAAERSSIETKSHLVLLATVILLGIRLLNWPFFYATLQSFITDIEGAMCIFGVTMVQRPLTQISEILKPITFFLIGFWLLFHNLDKSTRTAPLMGRKLLLLCGVALLVMAESLIDVILMFTIVPGKMVSCCTTVTDILDRPTRSAPESILGPGYKSILEIGYYVSNLLLSAALSLGLWRWEYFAAAKRRRIFLGAAFLLALGNAGIFVLTQIEVHAPKIMELPFHHCLYCLWQYIPDTILMYVLFILGTCIVGWAFALDVMGRTAETASVLPPYLKKLHGFALFCFAAALVMNTAHLLV